MSKKTIYEVGLLNNGLSVIRRQYIGSAELSQSLILVGELLSAIQAFSTTAYYEIPEVFQMEDFITSLYRFKCGG